MKTTGGSEHFLADPADATASADDPVVLDRADGDDIVVEHAAPHARSRRVRLAAGAAVAAVLVVAGIAGAVATRDHTPSTPSALRTVSAPKPRLAHPSTHTAAHKAETRPARPFAPGRLTKTTGLNVGPPASSATHPSTPPSVGTPPPTVATPPVEPTSVLVWSATPSQLSVKGGAETQVTVTVVNPTNGTVTLGTPLSCPPTFRGPRGAIIGGTFCEQITQTIQPHSTLTQRYTLYATDTGIANGKALTPGTYTATVEHQFKMTVNVTKT